MTTLRVRLIAPLESRIEFMRRKLGLSQKESARRVKTMDREHRQFVRSHFFKDPFNPHGYDLVLNFAQLAVTGCARLTVEALRCLQPES
jgi:cytidylate kinase